MKNRIMKTRLDLLKPKSKSKQRNTKMEQQFNDCHARWKEFVSGDKVYYKLHKTNDSWNWVEATITERLGSVNYRIKTNTPLGEQVIKTHANQLKRCHSNNELIDSFGLSDVSGGEIKLIIMPQQVEMGSNQPQDLDESDTFDDAIDEGQLQDRDA